MTRDDSPRTGGRRESGHGVRGGAGAPTAESVVAATRDAMGSECAGCAAPICGHDAVMSLVLGYRHTPRCHACLAAAIGEDVGRLVTRIGQYLLRRDCYRAGWSFANRHEGFADSDPEGPPPCMAAACDAGPTADPDAEAPTEEPAAGPATELPVAAVFDAGDMACGDLVLELRLRMRALEPGEILHVTARDPGAPTDIPAWCELTRHPLRAQRHPDYWIECRAEARE